MSLGVFLQMTCIVLKIPLDHACQEVRFCQFTQPVKLHQIQLSQSSNHSSSYGFTMTTAFAAELLSSAYQWSPPPPHSLWGSTEMLDWQAGLLSASSLSPVLLGSQLLLL